MKITRLKRGYVIRLSDSEFSAIIQQVVGDHDDPMESALPAVRAAYTKRTAKGGFFRVDEDRRASQKDQAI